MDNCLPKANHSPQQEKRLFAQFVRAEPRVEDRPTQPPGDVQDPTERSRATRCRDDELPLAPAPGSYTLSCK